MEGIARQPGPGRSEKCRRAMMRTCGWAPARRREWAHLPRSASPVTRPCPRAGRRSTHWSLGVPRQMLATALLLQVAAYIDAHAELLGAAGHRPLVRNGSHAAWEVMTARGADRLSAGDLHQSTATPEPSWGRGGRR